MRLYGLGLAVEVFVVVGATTTQEIAWGWRDFMKSLREDTMILECMERLHEVSLLGLG